MSHGVREAVLDPTFDTSEEHAVVTLLALVRQCVVVTGGGQVVGHGSFDRHGSFDLVLVY